jgi:hypothetical protein
MVQLNFNITKFQLQQIISYAEPGIDEVEDMEKRVDGLKVIYQVKSK